MRTTDIQGNVNLKGDNEKKKKERNRKENLYNWQKTERNSALFFRKTLETNRLSMGTCERSFRRAFSITAKEKKTGN